MDLSKLLIRILIGVLFVSTGISIAYSFLVYPTLIPGYGGGEQCILTESNEFTQMYPFTVSTPITISVEANDSIEIWINGVFEYQGVTHKFSIAGESNQIVNFTATTEVSVYMQLRQQVPLSNYLICGSFSSLTLVIFLFDFFITKKQKELGVKTDRINQ